MDTAVDWRILPSPSASQLCLELRGKVNVSRVRELRQAALDLLRLRKDVTIACEPVAYLDVSACQVLLALKKELHQQGNQMRLVGMSPSLQQLFARAGLWEALKE